MPDQLTTAQLTKALALPLHRQEIVKALFLLLDKGEALDAVIDLLSEIQPDLAATRAGLPEKACEGCEKNFTPLHGNQTYHSPQCRDRNWADKTYQRKHNSPGVGVAPRLRSAPLWSGTQEHGLGPSITQRNEPKEKPGARSNRK